MGNVQRQVEHGEGLVRVRDPCAQTTGWDEKSGIGREMLGLGSEWCSTTGGQSRPKRPAHSTTGRDLFFNPHASRRRWGVQKQPPSGLT